MNGGILEIELVNIQLSAGDQRSEVGLTPVIMCFFTVKDTGRGISSNHLNRFFNPYFTTRDVGKILGICLVIASELLQDMVG